MRTAMIAIALACASACGGDDKKQQLPKQLDLKTDATKVDDKKVADLKARAEAKAQAAREADIDKAASLPAQLPTDLETGCADAGKALDEYMQKRLAGDEAKLGRWNAIKEPDTRKLVEACKVTGKVEVAACEANALRTAPTTFTDEEKDVFVQACVKKFGGGGT